MNEAEVKKTILCIDDEDKILSALKRVFRQMPYRIMVTTDPVEGLDIAKLENPDLIFLDIKMPNMDGHEFMEKLKEQKIDHIPVVMLSGEKTMDDVFRGYKEGSVYYITKPTKSEYILNIVEYLIGDISDERRQEIEHQL